MTYLATLLFVALSNAEPYLTAEEINDMWRRQDENIQSGVKIHASIGLHDLFENSPLTKFVQFNTQEDSELKLPDIQYHSLQ